MENKKQELPTIYNLKSIVTALEKKSKQKAIVDKIFNTDYMFGNIDETMLKDVGFEFITMSNKAGFKTPIYRMGNIEAVFVDQILHMYETTI